MLDVALTRHRRFGDKGHSEDDGDNVVTFLIWQQLANVHISFMDWEEPVLIPKESSEVECSWSPGKAEASQHHPVYSVCFETSWALF